MGIKDLTQFLKKLEPNLFVSLPLEKFSGHTLGVDASIFLYKFMCVTAQFSGNWIDMFIALVQWLRKYNINPVFVFDGAPPEEKSATQKERKERKKQISDKISAIEQVKTKISEYPLNADLPDELREAVNGLLQVEINVMPRKQVIFELDNLYKKISGQSIKITKEDIKKLQDILGGMGLRCLQATGEAEKSCAWLMKKGYASGVITNDSDILIYGSTVFIQEIKPNKDDCTVIRSEDILSALQFSETQFQDFCIMCGMDYNSRIPKVGPAKAYELLKRWGSIDKIAEQGIDVTPLLHDRIKELIAIGDDIPFIGEFNINLPIPDSKKLSLLLLRSNSRYSPEQLVNYKSRFLVQ